MTPLTRTPPAIGPDTPVVVAARRTPIGTAGHGLAAVDASGLLAPVLRAVLEDLPALDGRPPQPDEVIVGNCLGPGGNLARYAALDAGLGAHVPAVTVDRQCGSGQEAVHHGATLIRAGRATLVLAGGVESASTAPYRAFRPTPGGSGEPAQAAVPYERAPFAPPSLGDPEMGAAAEDVADRFGISRQRQDRYAARSHTLTLAAAAAGAFADELVPIAGLSADERPRALREEVLARLRPAFAAGGNKGSVTAGNSCGISDGAAVVAVVPESVRAAWGVPGLALLDWLTVGVDPRWPGVGPVPAVERLLGRCGLDVGDLGALEITEAFAAQVLACTDAWRLDPFAGSVVCGQGGAIALGHPWGASGALLVVRLFARLVRSGADGGYGVATCAVGGGQGMALLAARVAG